MDASQIIKEFERLSSEEKKKVCEYLTDRLKKKERLMAFLDTIKGSGKGVWEVDAQEYVNRLRADDRNLGTVF
jgi:hypothetical protein